MTDIVDFTVSGQQKIHCGSCEQRIGNAMRRLPGILNVRASAQTQRVVVAIDPAQVSPEQVQAKMDQIGYQVTPQGGSE